MDKFSVYEDLIGSEGIGYAIGERLSAHTTVGIGGAASIFVRPKSVVEFIKAADAAKNAGVRTFIIGGGSNVLISDGGFYGATISTRGLGEIFVEAERDGTAFIRAFAGARLGALTSFCVGRGYEGLEFLCGIPGTVGGAVCMNAGCFGREVSDILVSADVYSLGRIRTYSNSDCGFSYRHSAFLNSGEFVISALFRTKTTDFTSAARAAEKFVNLRKNQPKGRSLGSVFKNGAIPAARLIDSCLKRGARVGGAYIAEKHANFILSDGTATASDYYDLVRIIKSSVKERTGITLNEEIRYVGEFI